MKTGIKCITWYFIYKRVQDGTCILSWYLNTFWILGQIYLKKLYLLLRLLLILNTIAIKKFDFTHLYDKQLFLKIYILSNISLSQLYIHYWIFYLLLQECVYHSSWRPCPLWGPHVFTAAPPWQLAILDPSLQTQCGTMHSPLCFPGTVLTTMLIKNSSVLGIPISDNLVYQRLLL